MSRQLLAVILVLLLSTVQAGADAPPPRQPPPLEFKGYLTPIRRALVSSTVQGRITEILVREGQQVKKGDIVARLDATRQVLDLKRAEARLKASQARLAGLKARPRADEMTAVRAELLKAEAVLQAGESEVNRLRNLRASNAISAEDMQKAESSLQAAKAEVQKQRAAVNRAETGASPEELRVTEAGVEVARADVETAQAALDATTLRAPIDGMVARVHVQVGSVTNPAAFGLATTASVCELADTSGLEVQVRIHERNLLHFFKGQRCEVRVDAFPNTSYPGVVDRISPVIDRDSNTFTLWVTVTPPKKEHGLPVDASAVVRFLPR